MITKIPKNFGLILIALLLLTGCNSKPASTQQDLGKAAPIEESQYQSWLVADAKEGFNAAIERDYRRLTVISGSLKKIRSTTYPELELGTALGALESTIFTQESEYSRMDNNINIPAEVKRELVPPGLLNALNNNRQSLDHVYRDVIKPYAEKKAKKQNLTVEQEKSVEQTTVLVFDITQTYSKLSQDRANMSVSEVEALVSELDKLQTQLNTVFFPL